MLSSLMGPRRDYCEVDFVSLVNVYQDFHLMKRLISQIKENCKNSVIIIGDGVKLEPFCKEGTIWFECDRAKSENQKGLWTQRYLELYLKNTTESHLIRVDPDTCIWQPFSLPSGEYDIFGTISPKRYKHPYVRGGCIGFTRSAAEKIVDSKMLLDDCYKGYNYQRYKHYRWKHEVESEEKFAFQDWIVGDIAYRLNLILHDWKEVCILGNLNIIPERAGFAITHPNPYLDHGFDCNNVGLY